ncbi:S-adenosyl-L-methionine-dependent methyltransferase [Eremomyces bilateralis CBS 781.70]|uniref:S-adenosyl-L-methionine-dependent methyltransferase n=1 Tax=Eremomyces bilateralis CBS 781.70 TaxID=1392243 RepID=A0A6G1GBF3_9PEZI|nr:S-adenosyl-L-methionine-dependent methyltransferase [Eremomyces bilateralis CBS 781.70]KAF1815266.1 S-adenosyl-L-methionine-dependent methyltransferase [Eremomyces bilateralis CBS 781.70]
MSDPSTTPPAPGAPPADQPQGVGHIEVDTAEGFGDLDSGFGDTASETTSLASSVRNHQYENGRRYHSYKAGTYLSPNDEQEADRLDMHHHMMLLQLNGELHLAPLDEHFSGRVLDLGAGTGIWAMDMADKYSAAVVTGIDLSPVQAQFVPPNCYFEVDDMEEPWTYRHPFELIHASWLAGSIRDWDQLVKQCYDNLTPGGWVEFKDWDYRPRLPDGSLDLPDNTVKKWHKVVMSTAEEKAGRSTTPAVGLKDRVTKTGFVNVQETVLKTPIGIWPKDPVLKEIGRCYRLALDEGLEAISLRMLTQLAGWSTLEAQVLNADFRKAMKEFPFYHNYHVIYGQKPPAGTS